MCCHVCLCALEICQHSPSLYWECILQLAHAQMNLLTKPRLSTRFLEHQVMRVSTSALATQAVLLILISALRRDGGSSATEHDTSAYVTYESQRLPNHSYVDVSRLDNKNSVQCHSPLHTCCSAAQGPDRGDWFNPWGHPLKFISPDGEGPYETRLPQCVEFRCNSRKACVSVSGLYRCEVAVRRNHVQQRIYIGLYGNGGGELRNSVYYTLCLYTG